MAAAKHYVAIFKQGSKVLSVTKWGEGAPRPKGTVMSVTFRLVNQDFMALNAGPHFKFNPAISFYVDCKRQKEVDGYWNKLLKGGKPSRCGWLEDKFGLSWQIIPEGLGKMLQDENKKKSAAVMAAMMKRVKIDLKTMKQAFDQAA